MLIILILKNFPFVSNWNFRGVTCTHYLLFFPFNPCKKGVSVIFVRTFSIMEHGDKYLSTTFCNCLVMWFICCISDSDLNFIVHS